MCYEAVLKQNGTEWNGMEWDRKYGTDGRRQECVLHALCGASPSDSLTRTHIHQQLSFLPEHPSVYRVTRKGRVQHTPLITLLDGRLVWCDHCCCTQNYSCVRSRRFLRV